MAKGDPLWMIDYATPDTDKAALWQQEAVRQDRLRGEAVTKLAVIRHIAEKHKTCNVISRDALIEILDVLDDVA